MSKIDDYELKIRRENAVSQYQKTQAGDDNAKIGNFDRSNVPAPPAVGQISGRSVTEIPKTSPNDSPRAQNYINTTQEDRLLPDFVNTVKKTDLLSRQDRSFPNRTA